MVLLSARRKYYQFKIFTSVLLSYKSIIYKSPNNPNQHILLKTSPSTNTQPVPSASIETLAISPTIPPTYTTSTSLTNSVLNKFCTDMEATTDSISVMIIKLDDTSIKSDNQEEKLTYI